MQVSLLDTARSTTNEVFAAVRVISRETPLLRSAALDELAECQLFVKAESLQHTGSFKLRGAYYRLKNLDPEERRNGVVAYSSGNFARGLARAGQFLGVPVTIVMPADVPRMYDDLARSLAAGERCRNETPSPTLCDALQAISPGAVPFSILQQTLSGALSVTDAEVQVAMRAGLEHLKLVLEPSGASALAAALAARTHGLDLGKRVGVVCSGGNIAAEDFAKLVAETPRH